MRTVCLDGKPVQQSIDCTILARAVAANQMAVGDSICIKEIHACMELSTSMAPHIGTYVYGIELHTHDVSLVSRGGLNLGDLML